MIVDNKLIFTEDETLELLDAFYKEALKFLNVSEDEVAQIKKKSFVPTFVPVDIDYQSRTIHVQIQFFRAMVALNPMTGNDNPTMYRMYGYMLAYVWSEYIATGKKLDFPRNRDAATFANALFIIKGIPIFNRQPISSEYIKILGYDPYDLQPVLRMLRNKFGIDCQIRRAKDRINNQMLELVSFTSDEHKKRGDKYIELYEENRHRVLPSIKEGDHGSRTNPFANVDEAADFILKLDKERLRSDRYRNMISNEQYFYDYETNSFRISWASPNVSYYHIESSNYPYFVANQLSQIRVGEPPRFSLKPSLSNNKFLYRGQAEFYAPCKPSLYRDSKKEYFVDDVIQVNEMEVLLREHPLVKLFERGFMLMHEFIRFKINYLGLSQHYYNNTPLLDLTSDMEVAKFFAVTSFDKDNDCYVKYDGEQLGVLYYYDIQSDSFTEREGRNYIIDAIGKQPFMRSGNQSGFLINLEKDDDFNCLPEVRYVFFKHDPEITSRIFEESMNGEKYMPQELLRTHWYKKISDNDERMKISYEALLLNFERNPHESHSRILAELRNKGFKVNKRYKSQFTEEELDSYYNNSEQIWKDFCSNVYFYGPEGALLKKHLLNLPNDPRYRWAFYRDVPFE